MEKKYFYVDNLLIYGRELYKKECFRLKFIKIEEGVYCLYDSKKRKIALSWKHPKDKEDWAIAFAICYHKLYGLPEPKTKNKMKEETAKDLKIEEHFFSTDNMGQLKICCGYGRNGDILYEFAKENNGDIFRLKPSTMVYVYEKEN